MADSQTTDQSDENGSPQAKRLRQTQIADERQALNEFILSRWQRKLPDNATEALNTVFQDQSTIILAYYVGYFNSLYRMISPYPSNTIQQSIQLYHDWRCTEGPPHFFEYLLGPPVVEIHLLKAVRSFWQHLWDASSHFPADRFQSWSELVQQPERLQPADRVTLQKLQEKLQGTTMGPLLETVPWMKIKPDATDVFDRHPWLQNSFVVLEGQSYITARQVCVTYFFRHWSELLLLFTYKQTRDLDNFRHHLKAFVRNISGWPGTVCLFGHDFNEILLPLFMQLLEKPDGLTRDPQHTEYALQLIDMGMRRAFDAHMEGFVTDLIDANMIQQFVTSGTPPMGLNRLAQLLRHRLGSLHRYHPDYLAYGLAPQAPSDEERITQAFRNALML